MNVVILTAGGVGARTHQAIPKQFISLNDKPIIIYTLEKFQQNKNIDEIVVVCLEGWQKYLEACAKQFGITKLNKIILGGATGQESIQNGIFSLKGHLSKDDIILIHDGNRPGVDDIIIDNCIKQVKEKGSSITKIPTDEVVFDIQKSVEKPALLNRDYLYRTQTPHGIYFFEALRLYSKAKEEGINVVALCSLLSYYGENLNFIEGSSLNFKITTEQDINLFKGLLK